MDEIDGWNDRRIGVAMRLWTGWKKATTPQRDSASVEVKFGPILTQQIIPILEAIETEFYSSDARFRANDVGEMSKLAAKQFRTSRPQVSKDVAKALAWCYSYDFK